MLIPKSVKEALLLDDITWKDFLLKGTEKAMKNVIPASTFVEQDKIVCIGYQHIDYHAVFDVKINFIQKGCFVAGGHMLGTLTLLT